MSRPSCPTLQVRADGLADLRLPMDASALAARHALAMLLPAGSWSAGSGGVAMRLRPDAHAPALAILEHYYGGSVRALSPEPQAAGPAQAGGGVPLPDIDGLDRDLARRVYRQMASVLHPDTGGSTEAFQRLQDWKGRHGL